MYYRARVVDALIGLGIPQSIVVCTLINYDSKMVFMCVPSLWGMSEDNFRGLVLSLSTIWVLGIQLSCHA